MSAGIRNFGSNDPSNQLLINLAENSRRARVCIAHPLLDTRRITALITAASRDA